MSETSAIDSSAAVSTGRRDPRPRESGLGLLFVIAIMMGVLWLFSGTKQVPVMGGDGLIQRDAAGDIVTVERNRFLEKANMAVVLTKASFIAVMAVGMTAVIALAGIDLSIGSIYALAAVIGAMVARAMPANESAWVLVPLIAVTCAGVGAVAGWLNGAATVYLRVHPFIITLGAMGIYRGTAFVMTRGETVTNFPQSFTKGFFLVETAGVKPIPTILMIVAAAAGSVVLATTRLGRYILAIGGNETAARYAGVPVNRVKLIVYLLNGALVGLAAWMALGYFGAADSNTGQGYELQVIAASVIGGASLSGGRGSAIGAVLGAIIVQLIDNGMLMLNVEQDWTAIVMGAAIVIAVVIDQAKRSLSNRSRA